MTDREIRQTIQKSPKLQRFISKMIILELFIILSIPFVVLFLVK